VTSLIALLARTALAIGRAQKVDEEAASGCAELGTFSSELLCVVYFAETG
jgi:hypothetical protein